MTTVISFSQNIALILSLTFVYGMLTPRLRQILPALRQTVNGLLFGLFAIVSMTLPIVVAPGVFYDGRTLVICVAGLYLGVIPATIASVLVILYRIILGGLGALSGAGNAITVALISIAAYLYFQRRGSKPTALHLFAIGLVLACTGLLWASIIPQLGADIASTSLMATLVLYPLALPLLGALLANQQHSLEVEQARRENERRFRALFDTSSQFIWLLRPDGCLLEANRTALGFAGVTLAEVVNRPFWETIWWTIAPETQAQLQTAVARAAQGESIHYEVDIWGASRQPTTIEFSLRPIRNEAGQVVLLTPEGHDISERKQLQRQELDLTLERERSRLLKKFIADVSHDLRTPLSVIRLNLEVLQRVNDPAKLQKRVEVLIGQEQHLTRLLTDMMAMLSLDNADDKFDFAPVDGNELAKLLYEGHEAAAGRKKLTYTLALSADPLPISADQVELGQALGKLISNALSYTPAEGTITISTRAQAGMAIFEIRDTGIGISPDDLPNIFQRFYRADNARSLDTGGSGLGLPIAQKIVEAHRGRIDVESVVDGGSTFRIAVPLRDVAILPAATPEAPA